MAEKNGFDSDILASLKQLITIMKEDDLSEVCIEQKDTKIKIKRMSYQSDIAAQGVATQGMVMLTTEEEMSLPPATDDTGESDGLIVFVAPMVGTFFRAPTPEAEPFVNVGDEVEAAQVICVIDAMKLMNEITADIDGVIVDILVKDGQPVEYDQPIFRIKPK